LRSILFPLIKTIACGFVVFMTMSCSGSIEKARYEVTTGEGDFELRLYQSQVVVETEVATEMEEAGGQAFRKLFNYISGNNQSRQKIAMTSPVSQKALSEKIEMTSPVAQKESDQGWTVSFLLPAKYSFEGAPLPLDSSVKLRLIPSRYMVAKRYSGRWTEEGFLKNKIDLEKWLRQNELEVLGEAEWARYNAPYTPWFMRRNEVLIPVKYSPAQPLSTKQ
jgi:hypothetical protein